MAKYLDFNIFAEVIEQSSFIVLDVETANSNRSSICQIGLAAFSDSGMLSAWGTYIDPQDRFENRNIAVHGITARDVQGSPTFIDCYNIFQKIENKIIVQHSSFDKSAMNKASEKHQLNELNYTWVDSVLIAKRTWKDLEGGYNLANLAGKFGINFGHHDAIEDVMATGKVVLQVLEHSKIPIHDWVTKQKRPIASFYR